MGGSSSSSNGGGGTEAPNSLVSLSQLRILDLLCEGPAKGFANMGGQYGYDPLTATYYNNVQVRNTDGSYNFNISGQGFSFSYTLGYSGQIPMVGFEKVAAAVPLPPDTRLSNPPTNAGLPKVVLATFNTQQFPDADSVIVNFRVPQMYAVSDKGDVNGFEVDVKVEIALNGGAFNLLSYPKFVGKNTTPYFRTYQFTLPKTTPPQTFYQWTLRFTKTSQDVLSTKIVEDIYVDSISVVSASQFSYPGSALVGTYIDALQFGSIPSRAYLIDGLLVKVPSGYTPPQISPNTTFTRQFLIDYGDGLIGGLPTNDPTVYNGIITGMSVTGGMSSSGTPLLANTVVTLVNAAGSYIGIHPNAVATDHNATLTFTVPNSPSWTPAVYPNVWNGTFQTGVWTSNPAWVFYDLITNPRYGLGQYINTNAIDIWTLYQISQFCDQMVDNGQGIGVLEPQFTCNVFIQNPEDAYNMLLNLSSVFRGMLYYANGTIRANLTDDKTPVFNYTNANVVQGIFNYSSTARNARHSAIRVKYTDPNNLYRDNYVLVEDGQSINQYGYNLKQIDAFGCTSLGQATRVANWVLTTERLRTETVSFQVGLDGLYVRPGDVFNLYDNFRMNKSQGGRVISFDANQQFVTLDRPVNLDSGCIYALTCIVPTFNYDATGDVTGSSQIPQIRNPQIQSRMVLNAQVSGLSTLQVTGGFSGLSANSVWILSATGVYTANYIPTVFEQAPQYECLALNMSSPGVMDVLALKYNTGINYTVNTGFTTIMNPVNSGDQTAPAPVTNFTGQYITGQLADASFFSYLNLTWVASSSSDAAYYIISGDPVAGNPSFLITATPSTGFAYVAGSTGRVDFSCTAVGKGGGLSVPAYTAYVFPTVPGLDTNQIKFWMLPDGFGDLEQMAVFYNRPDPSVTSTRAFYATGFGAPFKEVLDQSFYPALGVSPSGLSTSGTTVWFNTNSYDAPTTLIGQGAIQQAQNTLLFLVDDELMSVGPVSGLGTNKYAFSVSRGVLGTSAATHSANTSGWAFYSADINSFTDGSLVKVFDAGGNYSTGVAARYFQIENSTALLQGAIVPSTPGVEYTIPNPLPNAPSSLTASAPGGQIVHLNWTASTSNDVLQYQVYRAVSPFSSYSLIGYEPSNTFFDDTTVTIGTTYQYYVLTEATNEQTSVKSNIVSVTPPAIPTGANLTPPSNPTACSLSSSGYYLASDGTVFNSLTYSVPALPAGAIGQYITYGISNPPLIIGNDLANSGFSTSAKIDDLTPGTSYYVGTTAYSPYGVQSSTILANGAPFVAPGKAPFVVVTPPTGVRSGPALYGSVPLAPPKYTTSYTYPGGGTTTLLSAITGSWTASPDTDIAFYEYTALIAAGGPPSPSAPINYLNTVPAAQLFAILYNQASSFSYMLWIRAINRSGGVSAWSQATNGSTLFLNLAYAGDLGSQTYTSTQLQTAQIGGFSAVGGVKIGDRAQSPNQLNTFLANHGTLFITGGTSNYEQQSLNISSLGFNAPPSAGVITSNYPNVVIKYNAYYGGQTSSNVTLDVNTTDGTNLPNANMIINYYFSE